ncbi:MAG TPA: urease accessory UreF family protein [Nitrosospira sp.]|nr:urease accessory UreF family protein [Nitrosospira sp.]
MTLQSTSLLALLQLASPSLPIGAYTYSQGLESAIEKGLVKDESSARGWITEYLGIIADFEAPVLWRLLKAFSLRDMEAVDYWTECFIAARDTAEFRAETIQMGYSLGKLVVELKIADDSLLEILTSQPEIPLPAAFACAAEALAVPHEDALAGMLFSMVENQVLVCVKSVPLGQVSGQRLLLSLHAAIEAAVHHACRLADDDLSNWTPGLSLLSMQHEVQYSRIYRS